MAVGHFYRGHRVACDFSMVRPVWISNIGNGRWVGMRGCISKGGAKAGDLPIFERYLH